MSEANIDQIRQYWDDDALVYDISPRHQPTDASVVAAWTAAVKRVLPAAPARVLDCGAGTGFLSLIAARLGHRVTALDMSAGMLEVLRQKAGSEQVSVEIQIGPAHEPPSGFDAVIERNLLWTLPDPVGTLAAWKEANPGARLASFGGIWGSTDPWERVRAKGRELATRVKGSPPEHHASYSPGLVASLPLARGTTPDRVIESVLAAGWRRPGLERLRDVEWAEALTLGPLERLLGVNARFLITAEA
jgi:SAM-dependent methyltransferase